MFDEARVSKRIARVQHGNLTWLLGTTKPHTSQSRTWARSHRRLDKLATPVPHRKTLQRNNGSYPSMVRPATDSGQWGSLGIVGGPPTGSPPPPPPRGEDDTARRVAALTAEGGTFDGYEGFVKDDFARRCQPVQQRPFLMTGVPPAVGQRLEIQMTRQSDGMWFRMSGLVTLVDDAPSPPEGVVSPQFPCGCGGATAVQVESS